MKKCQSGHVSVGFFEKNKKNEIFWIFITHFRFFYVYVYEEHYTLTGEQQMQQIKNINKGEEFLTDDEIVALYFSREERAIIETDRKYRSFLISVAYRILNDQLDCEECLNDTYLSIWNSVPPKKPSPLKAFASAIIRRKAFDRYRQKSAQKRIPTALIGSLSDFEFFLSDESIDDEINRIDLARTVSEFVRSLPERQKYVFVTRYYMGQTVAEIADNLGCSRSMINKEIARIKEGLTEKLTEEGFIV
jgi:RNA polymerase sigma-70 factor (ECF subfamily)